MEQVLARQKEFGMNRELVGYLGGVLLEGGSDTTSSFLQTLVLGLTAFPDVQKKAQVKSFCDSLLELILIVCSRLKSTRLLALTTHQPLRTLTDFPTFKLSSRNATAGAQSHLSRSPTAPSRKRL
jgi:hypothetical protein